MAQEKLNDQTDAEHQEKDLQPQRMAAEMAKAFQELVKYTWCLHSEIMMADISQRRANSVCSGETA